jgi:hypothetical protein
MSKLSVKAEDRLAGSENFTAWKYRIMSLFAEHDLEDFVTGEVEEPTTATARAAFKRKQNKARNIILNSVKDNLVPIIGPLSTPKECYDALADLYEKKVHTQKRVLKKQLHTMKMEKNDTVATFFSKISQVRDQLIAIGVSVEDDDLVQAAIDGLPAIWGVFLASVNGRETQPNFARLWHDCLEEEGRMNSRKDFPVLQEHALAAKNKRWKKFPKSKGKGKKPTGKLSHLNPHLSKVNCYNCGKLGHYARECRNPPAQQKRKGRFQKRFQKFQASVVNEEAKPQEEPQRRQTRAATREQELQKEHYLVSALSGTITKSQEIWLIDSGASKHMTGFKQNLANYQDRNYKAKVELGDDGTYEIKGFGSTSFQFHSGTIFHIDEILYVPGLKKNLISVPVLESKGYTVIFSKGKALLCSPNKDLNTAITIGTRECGLYKLSGQVIQALAHETINPCELWHRRLGHLNFNALPGLQKMVTGMPVFSVEHNSICKGCSLGKNTKKPYPLSNRKSPGVLDLIHSDLCGPMSAPSMNGCIYYIIFIDDCSRKTWIYFLKTKDESFSRFQDFKNLVENQTGRHIRVFRTDNGKEFDSFKYDELCRASGIKRELTVPYNPQQNGVAERKNRTICEAARAMMHDQNLPLSLWAEAASTAVYIQNRCPHKVLDAKTPEEVFTGSKPSVEHLRIFGSPVYIHIPKEKRTKLEPSGKKGIFVGYSETSKAYRIYIPGQKFIEVSRDVTFHEETAFRRARDLVCDTEEQEAPRHDSPSSDEQMEEASEIEADPVRDSIDFPMELPPVKRKPAWCREILREAERHSAPKGTFRESRKPDKYSGLISELTTVIDSEPSTFIDAAKHQVWKDAMSEEYNSILKNDVWTVVPRPRNKSVVTSKWLYKIKHAADGSVEKYKARFVARGFSQKEGIDYDEIFAPVARYSSIRTIISLAAVFGWKLHQMDVKTAFLNGEVEEEVYIEQPEGFILHNKRSHVCKLKKALYGLKQAPRAWYGRIDSFLQSLGFTKSIADPNLYIKVIQNHPVLLVLYVDDLFLTGEEDLIAQTKRELSKEFEMKDLGLMHYFLGLEVWQKPGEIFLTQSKYAIDILRRFGMMDCKSMTTPMISNLKKLQDQVTGSDPEDPTMYRQIIGSLMYLVHTRPDICYAVNALSQFMCEPKHIHMVAVKHILRYVRGTIAYGLRYTSSGGVMLHGFTDSDWMGSVVDRKSTSGYCFSLGSAMISWSSRKQGSIAQSTAEAEYIAASAASREAVWLRKLLSDLFRTELEPTVIHCDNQSCIKLTENPVFHDRSKHIEMRYHYIRDMIQRKVLSLQYVPTAEQTADIFTKPLPLIKFAYFRDKLGVAENTSLAEREC